MSRWDPDAYLRFEQERTQPSRDLVARIELSRPNAIVDIGCGPGTSTRVLREAWPEADVTGLDNSEDMIHKAQATYPAQKWVLADAARWQPDKAYDLVFANATLHWIPHHEQLLKRLFDAVKEGGVLAGQVPFNVESPLLKAVAGVSESPRWRELMRGSREQIFYRDETYYYDILSTLSDRIDMWMTTYLHVMESQESLLEWHSSTGLKVYLDRIQDDAGKLQFKNEILEACKADYPVRASGKVLFPFKRIFFAVYKAT